MSSKSDQFDLFSLALATASNAPTAAQRLYAKRDVPKNGQKAAEKAATAQTSSIAGTTVPHAPFICVGDVAIRYSVSVPTIWRWLKLGKLPSPYRIGCGSTRWAVSDLDAHDQRLMQGAQK